MKHEAEIHAVLARAALTRAVRELQETFTRCTQGMECDPEIVLPHGHTRAALASAMDALDQANSELAKPDTKPITRTGKPDRRAPYPDRQNRPRQPAIGNADEANEVYRRMSPRQRYLVGTGNVKHVEIAPLFSGRSEDVVSRVTEKCKGWLAAGPNLKTVKTEVP